MGKTSFIRRYVQNAFRADYKATIGVDFALKIVRWSENQTIKLQLWDIAGKLFSVQISRKCWVVLFVVYRTRKIYVDDSCLLQRSPRLHHHV